MDDLYCNSDIQMKGFPILTLPFGQIPLRPVKNKKRSDGNYSTYFGLQLR
ncbi:hypothetical protein FHW74_002360 [Atlantibacter sp. RC6]|jgi:hypothetical protein|nr:hypothetical protein [Atlantibacter sp. RC6]